MHKKILLGTINFLQGDANAWLPYAVGCLISYCRGIPEVNERYTFMDPIFASKPIEEYRDQLLEADILGLTNYIWNQSYNDRLSKYYTELRPDGMVIYGGPQVPDKAALYEKYCEERPWVGAHIAGLGEIAFAEWLLDLPTSNKVLRELPTPYTDGVFDYVFNDPSYVGVCVPIETDRGCPYSCAFCDWGGQAKSKITKFGYDECATELEYIYSQPKVTELFFANANFGVFKDDVRITQKCVDLQKKCDNKILILYGGFAKNGSKNIPPIIDMLNDDLDILDHNMKVSFQTHTKEVLEIINRANIKNEKLLPLVKEQKDKGHTVTSEMIIALPGETADSWLQSLHYQLHEIGINKAHAFILSVVSNTEIADPDYQEKYGIATKRVSYGQKDHDQIIIKNCFSYDMDELVRMFDYHWVFNNFVNTGMVTEVDSLRDQTYEFFDKLDQMPILKSLVERNRKTVRNIFSDEAHTKLEKDQSMWIHTLRHDDLQVMIDNKEQVSKEIGLVFKLRIGILWTVDSPYRKIPDFR